MRTIFLITIIFFFHISFGQIDSDETKGKVHKKYYINNLDINSVDSDFGPSFFGDREILFSSSGKHKGNSNKKWDANGQRFLNFYIGEVDSIGNVSEIRSVSSAANTKYHESNAIFTKDKKKVYFTRNNYYQSKKNVEHTSMGRIMRIALYIADVDADGNFYNIVPFPYNSNKYSTGHPALSQDEKTLYFTSDMKGTVGKTDIFKVEIKANGTFTVPENLGGNVNTKGREMFPFVAEDGTLYFSSDGRDGFGKLDIYKTVSSDLDIAAVQNLGEPFNSSRDDFAFIIKPGNHEGYFSSNRVGGKGDDDLYYFYDDYTFINRQKVKKNLNQLVVEEEIKPILINISIRVIDDRTKKNIEGAKVKLIDENTGKVIEETNVDESGQVSFEAENDKDYKVSVSKPLYKEEDIIITVPKDNPKDSFTDVGLTPETRVNETNEVIVDLNPIYFDFDSSEITELAAEELDKVVDMMEKYPTMIIEGASFTDSRGRDAYNQALSERRAASTVNYIRTHLIKGNSDLIYAIGYGETKLVNQCSNGVRCTEAEHALNRRTEFKIVNVAEFQ